MVTSLIRQEINATLPGVTTGDTLSALLASVKHAQKIFGKVAKLRGVPASTPLSHVLEACLGVALTQSTGSSEIAGRQCSWFARTYYSIDELITQVARLCDRYPHDSFQFASHVLIGPKVSVAQLFDSSAVMLLPWTTFNYVFGDWQRSTYLKLHWDELLLSLSTEEAETVQVLFDEWRGSLSSLIETARLLQFPEAYKA
jgi:hypothetical protein